MYFLNVYKEKGMTSFDVIHKLRKILNIKKIGHSGTLDPLAQGILQVAVGNASRLLEYLDDAIISDPEGGYADDVNKAFFVGRIVHQYAPREDIQILTLACKSRSSVDYVEITCFKRQAELAALMEEGDMVAIAGSVRTSPSKKDERITNENIICKDIAAIPSEEE